jgi:hypothetical protein
MFGICHAISPQSTKIDTFDMEASGSIRTRGGTMVELFVAAVAGIWGITALLAFVWETIPRQVTRNDSLLSEKAHSKL